VCVLGREVSRDPAVRPIDDQSMADSGEETSTPVGVAAALQVVEPGVGGRALLQFRAREVGLEDVGLSILDGEDSRSEERGRGAIELRLGDSKHLIQREGIDRVHSDSCGAIGIAAEHVDEGGGNGETVELVVLEVADGELVRIIINEGTLNISRGHIVVEVLHLRKQAALGTVEVEETFEGRESLRDGDDKLLAELNEGLFDGVSGDGDLPGTGQGDRQVEISGGSDRGLEIDVGPDVLAAQISFHAVVNLDASAFDGEHIGAGADQTEHALNVDGHSHGFPNGQGGIVGGTAGGDATEERSEHLEIVGHDEVFEGHQQLRRDGIGLVNHGGEERVAGKESNITVDRVAELSHVDSRRSYDLTGGHVDVEFRSHQRDGHRNQAIGSDKAFEESHAVNGPASKTRLGEESGVGKSNDSDVDSMSEVRVGLRESDCVAAAAKNRFFLEHQWVVASILQEGRHRHAANTSSYNTDIPYNGKSALDSQEQ